MVPPKQYDLLLKCVGGRVHFGSDSSLRDVDIGVAGNVVTAMERNLNPLDAKQVYLIGRNQYVTIGAIDPHVHYAPNCPWSVGMRPEQHSLYHGSTMVVDAGSAGRNGIDDFFRLGLNRHSLDQVPRVDMRAFLNIVAGGLANQHHECYDLRYLNPDETADAAKRFQGSVLGIKVRLGWLQASEQTWRGAMRLARQAAEKAGLPLMVHINHGPRIEKLLGMMTEGDIVTHCFHGRGQDEGCTILSNGGTLRQCVKSAIRRGIYFDLGHGQGGYSAKVADQAVRAGLLDIAADRVTISTDLHAGCVHGPAFNFWTTMTKALSWPKMRLEDVFTMVTRNVGRMLRLPEDRCLLKLGSLADLSIWQTLTPETGEFPLVDADQHVWHPSTVVQAVKVVRNGVLV